MSEKAPSYRKILAGCFPTDPDKGRNGVFPGIPMDEYRISDGIAPSDVKIASEEIGKRRERGHLTRLANDRLARWHVANDSPLPPGLDAPRKSADFELGNVYHSLLLTPQLFDTEYAILTEEKKGELVALSRERKKNSDKFPTAYSGRSKEAQEFKATNGRLPESDEEKEAVLAATQERFLEDCSFHPRLTEYVEWQSEQAKAGIQIIGESVKDHAERMIDALHRHPESSEVGEYLAALKLDKTNVETCMYAVASFGRDENAFHCQLKGRPDAMPAGDAILDPKTCASAHPEAFAATIDDFSYDLSMAAYVWMTELLEGHPTVAALDFPKTRAGFLAQEKTPPYLARIHWMPDDWLAAMKRRYKTEVMRLANLYRGKTWSGEMMKHQIGELMPTPYKEKEIDFYLQ